MFLMVSPGRSLLARLIQARTQSLNLRGLWSFSSGTTWSQASRLDKWGPLTLPAIGYL